MYIEKFEVNVDSLEPSFVYHKKRYFVWVTAIIDVKPEQRKNPFLGENWTFHVGLNGSLKSARRMCFGDEKKRYEKNRAEQVKTSLYLYCNEGI